MEEGVKQLIKVESRMLYAVGYDEATRTLEVVFNTGGIYRYFDIPKEVHEGLMAAESKGRYMHTYVLNLYPYERIRRRRWS